MGNNAYTSRPSIPIIGPFGAPENISLDTNRPDEQGETVFRVRNAVALPSRDIYLDLLKWVTVPATVTLALDVMCDYFLPPLAGVFIFSLLMLPVLLLLALTFNQSNTHKMSVIYRGSLIFLGVALAFMPVYVPIG